MALFPKPSIKKALPIWRSAPLLFFILAGSFILSTPVPASCAENIPELRNKLSELSAEISNSEQKSRTYEKEETRLTDEIRKLKTRGRNKTDFFLTIRTEKALNKLREILSLQEKEDAHQEALHHQWTAARIRLKQEIENTIRKLIERADFSFKTGDEETSDARYKEALLWMGLLEPLKEDPVSASPLPASRSRLILDGKENLETLQELSDIGRNDIDQFQKEIIRLEEMRKEYLQDIQLRKQLVLPPKFHEKEGKVQSGPKSALGKEIDRLEESAKKTGILLQRYRSTLQNLKSEVDEIEKQIRFKEKYERMTHGS